MDTNARLLPLLGSIAIGIVGFQVFRKVLPWIYANIIGPRLMGPTVDVRQMGEWAVVTGSTDGIGKAYARELARKGLKLVLISRSAAKLDAVAKEIGNECSVEVRTIAVDFTNGPEIYEKIRTQVENLDVGVLVNNVGISYTYPDYFLDYCNKHPTFLQDIIAANVHSVTYMCALLMPRMVGKRKGIVINISSTAAVIPNPLVSVYAATKAFVNKFSDDLNVEYKGMGLIIQSVQPGYVATNMTKIRKPSIFAPTPEVYAKSALATVGIAPATAGYLPHALLQLLIHTAEALFGDSFARNVVLKNILITRNKALKKQTKEK